MKNKFLLIILLLTSSQYSFSQDRFEGDLDVMTFLGRVPQKTESNSLADNILTRLFYNIQPENYPKIGYLNLKGDIVIEPKYNFGTDFYGDYANIIKDSVYGYINKEGGEVFIKKYEKTFFYYGDTGYAIKNGKYGLINRKGDSLTPFQYTNISNFGFEHFRGQTEVKRAHILDANGKVIFNSDLQYDIRSHYFDSDSLFVYQEIMDGNKMKGLVNIKGEILCKPKYQEIYFINDSELYVAKQDNKFGFINKVGEAVIPFIYDEVGLNINENLITAQKNGKWGFVNRKNEEQIPFIYEKVHAFKGGRAFVKKGEFYGVINKQNIIKVPFNLERTGFQFFTEKLALFKKEEKYGFINRKGKIKIPAVYEKALPFFNDLAYVELNGEAGYINKNGEEVIPIKYKQLWLETEGIIRFAE
ncbi:WG repeat-containing protein [Gillisia sp. Q332]|uniref:WG repeat-containing protein n=1 Tax=Gillisia xinjiangensis TaxID=3384765 RepID=UPI00391B0D4B